ncbi:MAG: acyl-(acyl-carrier-protein)--UDP-N-acetylglucosamine O-acyltransferase [Betaproteobacteria bacterium]|jgi:UDP-N-acetylglucosamine acyltransferase|nr:acyl-(acyl-carrier-protein)--UDP-N-acetylglucosamine O-acyltransferase [Betaproteobacteria bacterium]MEA3152775.1 UDP-N-acetylglucosamine acyltransferase [Betaproteobacteria bacterium]
MGAERATRAKSASRRDAIHPTAIVDPAALIAADVEVGPYTVLGPHVEIGSGSRIGPHTVITGHTRLGKNNTVSQFVSLGDAPQDKKYGGEPTRLEIGDNNTIREFCTLNRGTAQDAGVTRIGDDNWIMAYVHIAHDCQIGSRTVFANNAQLAGHVRVDDDAILGGFTVVHQFVRIGKHSISGMGTILLQDVPPYIKVSGNPSRPYGINAEGLRRRGFSAQAIAGLKRAYRTLYRSSLGLEEAQRELAQQAQECPEVQPLLDFVAAPSRGIIR